MDTPITSLAYTQQPPKGTASRAEAYLMGCLLTILVTPLISHLMWDITGPFLPQPRVGPDLLAIGVQFVNGQ